MKVFYSELISWTELREYVFIFNETTNMMYKIEGILKDLWLAINKENEVLYIIKILSEMYEIDQNTLQRDVLEVIQSFEVCGLLIRR